MGGGVDLTDTLEMLVLGREFSRELTYPTLGSSENHRLKMPLFPWRVIVLEKKRTGKVGVSYLGLSGSVSVGTYGDYRIYVLRESSEAPIKGLESLQGSGISKPSVFEIP